MNILGKGNTVYRVVGIQGIRNDKLKDWRTI